MMYICIYMYIICMYINIIYIYKNSQNKGPICELLNASFTTGVFPDTLKKAYVVAIPKSIDIASNYRNISILCAMAKVFEYIFLDRILAERSTVSNLILFQSTILEAFATKKSIIHNLFRFFKYVRYS